MAIAVDASTPIRFNGLPNISAAITSASFTPPVDALLVFTVQMDSSVGAGDPGFVISNTGFTVDAWTTRVTRGTDETTAGGYSAWYTARVTASAAGTVSWTRNSAGGGNGIRRASGKVWVLTGVDVTGTPVDTVTAANEGGSTTNNLNTTNVTPGETGLLLASSCDWTARGLFQASANLTEETEHYAGEISVCSGYRTCSSGVALNANLNAGGGSAAQHKWVQIVVREAAALADTALNGSSALSLIATAALTTAISLAGAVTASASTSAILTSQILFNGAATVSATASSVLTTAIPLTGTSTAAVTATSALTTAIPLTGASTASATATSVLTTAIPLTGAATASLTTASALTTAIRLIGAASLAVTGTGEIEGGAAQFLGAASLSATGTSDLTTSISFASVATGTITATSSLTTAIPLTGAGLATVTAAGALETAAAALVGAATSQVTTASTLTTAIPLAGASTVTVTSAGAFESLAPALVGLATLQVTTAASLATEIALAGTVTASVIGSSDLTTAILLAGVATVTATAGASAGIPNPDIIAFDLAITRTVPFALTVGGAASGLFDPAVFDPTVFDTYRIAHGFDLAITRVVNFEQER